MNDIKSPLTGKTLFTKEELQCRASGQYRLAKGFVDALQALRVELDESMYVSSCCRSTEHNKTVGGAPGSFHICDGSDGCCAIDISIKSSAYAAKLVKLALNKGWSVGVSSKFIHLDRRTDFDREQKLFGY
ncbi:MAG: D-Ala-D-Ala carboxypeptidase family metallohydrolase [Nanoarchaeota archaeon]|nr:D-Ala-D-Ala carboxypeptidase family metallohydrolase [Nanoarchaeota archaeon]